MWVYSSLQLKRTWRKARNLRKTKVTKQQRNMAAEAKLEFEKQRNYTVRKSCKVQFSDHPVFMFNLCLCCNYVEHSKHWGGFMQNTLKQQQLANLVDPFHNNSFLPLMVVPESNWKACLKATPITENMKKGQKPQNRFRKKVFNFKSINKLYEMLLLNFLFQSVCKKLQ